MTRCVIGGFGKRVRGLVAWRPGGWGCLWEFFSFTPRAPRIGQPTARTWRGAG